MAGCRSWERHRVPASNDKVLQARSRASLQPPACICPHLPQLDQACRRGGVSVSGEKLDESIV
eukprot:scaffold155351_cov31-Tisochrysis_lutea.AAC.5